jgi:hypothetical protein
MWSTSIPPLSYHATGLSATNSEFLRRYARRLLRDARAPEASKAMPVLRRIVAVRLVPEMRLTDLYASRTTLQLKHLLHMLARELGFPAWEVCKREIDCCDTKMLDRYRLELGMFGDYEKNWFVDIDTALAWQGEHGGYLVRYGKQAVAILA